MSTYGLWMSAAGMKVNEHRQTLLANNLANGQTTGFKRDLALFRERANERFEAADGFAARDAVFDAMPGGVNVRPPRVDFEQGPLEATGRPLDVAINGRGFFSVSDGSQARYTRDGRFTLNAEGDLTLSSGGGRWRVLDDGGAVINVEPDGEPVTVTPNGTVRQGSEEIARIGMVDADDPRGMRKAGETLFEAGSASMQAVDATLVPESLEGSNFDVMTGLASMIEASRAYEMNAQLIRLSDQTVGVAINTVGRLA